MRISFFIGKLEDSTFLFTAEGCTLPLVNDIVWLNDIGTSGTGHRQFKVIERSFSFMSNPTLGLYKCSSRGEVALEEIK